MQTPHAHLQEIAGPTAGLVMFSVTTTQWSPACAQQELFPNERMPSAGFHRADPRSTVCHSGAVRFASLAGAKKREDKRFNFPCAH